MTILPLLLLLTGAEDAEPSIRWFEFRDGTRLPLELVDGDREIEIVADGAIRKRAVKLSQIAELTLARTRTFAQKRALVALVVKLGAAEFDDRQSAKQELEKLGPAVRADLAALRPLFTDAEIRIALDLLLKKWPAPKGEPEPLDLGDLLVLDAAHPADFGDAGIPVRIDGVTFELPRADLRFMSRRPLGPSGPLPAITKDTLTRIGVDEFSRGCVEEAFETAPDGRPLTVGDNVQRLFAAKGFVLSTPVAGSFVSVNDFSARGRSGGLSVANNWPLWQGEVEIRFFKPDRPKEPAGVWEFGCWVAEIKPNGTWMHAYDIAGREVARVPTTRGPGENEFLGFRSRVPIHRIRIIPVPELDRDFTLDDFVFTPPITTDEVPDPQRLRVELTGNRRVMCLDLRPGAEGVTLAGLPGGLPELTVAWTDLRRAIAPRGAGAIKQPRGVFAELTDGSILFGSEPAGAGRPVFARDPAALARTDLAGLRGADHPRSPWVAKPGTVSVYDATDRNWRRIERVTLGEEAVLWTAVGGGRQARAYGELPPLWLRKPPTEPAAGNLVLRTLAGDRLMLGPPSQAAFAGSTLRGLSFDWSGARRTLDAGALTELERTPGP